MKKGEVLCWCGEGCLKNSDVSAYKSKYPPRDRSVRAKRLAHGSSSVYVSRGLVF